MTPDLSYYWEGAREQCEDNKWDEEKEKKKRRNHNTAILVCAILLHIYTHKGSTVLATRVSNLSMLLGAIRAPKSLPVLNSSKIVKKKALVLVKALTQYHRNMAMLVLLRY